MALTATVIVLSVIKPPASVTRRPKLLLAAAVQLAAMAMLTLPLVLTGVPSVKPDATLKIVTVKFAALVCASLMFASIELLAGEPCWRVGAVLSEIVGAVLATAIVKLAAEALVRSAKSNSRTRTRACVVAILFGTFQAKLPVAPVLTRPSTGCAGVVIGL